MSLSLPASRGCSWGGHALSLLAGASLPLAFAPYEYRWVSFISLGTLFFVWWRSHAKQARLRGYLFGLGYFGVGVYWIYYSLTLFGDAIAPFAVLITIAFVLVLALYPAALGWLLVRCGAFGSAGRALGLLLIVPAAWTLCEWFRGWFLSGFPWLAIGYSQLDAWLAGYAPVLGVYGVGWLTALSAAAFLLLLVGTRNERIIALSTIVAVWFVGYALQQVNWSQRYGEPITVRMVQGNIEQSRKFAADMLSTSIEIYTRLSVSEQPVDLVLWPESAIPTTFAKIDYYLGDYAREQYKNHGTHIISGGFYRDEARDSYYNSLKLLHDSESYYHKQHLVPFGEYLPFRTLLAPLAQFIKVPQSDLQPGPDSFGRLSVKGVEIGASICYEDAFGEQVVRQLPQAKLLLNFSNDSWFGDSAAPYQHLEKARMRTLEVSRPMVRVTNTGVSAAINYDGQIMGRIALNKAEGLNVTVQPRQGATPYAIYANTAIVLIALLSLLLGVAVQRRHA